MKAAIKTKIYEILKHPIVPALDQDRQEIQTALGMIAMRKAGIFAGVYCDQGRLRVSFPAAPMLRVSVRWDRAAKAVEEFRFDMAFRKPMRSAEAYFPWKRRAA